MFYLIEDSNILQSVHTLPKDFKKGNVLYPLRQLYRLGYMNEVIGLGWLPEEKEKVQFNPDTHYIEGYSYIVGYNKVVATPIIREKQEE